jgi:nicotinate-nucleotide adenylyltransferase
MPTPIACQFWYKPDMRRLCFGGSFNPIHHGHLICARSVAETARFDRVVLMPSAQPPHKQGPGNFALAAPQHRLEMCRLAATADPDLFEVDDTELHRPGNSYTFDTVQQLKSRGQTDVTWLIGADMLLYLPNWHRAEELVREAQFLVMARPGWTFDWPQLPESFRHLQEHVIVAPLLEISATNIRRRVALGLSVAYFVPDSVSDYIVANRLYR